jgi:hypothetical protein
MPRDPITVLMMDTLDPGCPEMYSAMVGMSVEDLDEVWLLACANGIEDGWLATARWYEDTSTIEAGDDPLKISIRLSCGATPRQAAYALSAAMSAAAAVADSDWEHEKGTLE